MKRITVLAATAALALSLAACGSSTTAGGADRDALPQSTSSSAAPAETTEPVSTCDKAREAILTGSPAEIKAAMKALVKDKKADATAREAAQDYLNEKDPDLKQMQVDLVQMACAI